MEGSFVLQRSKRPRRRVVRAEAQGERGAPDHEARVTHRARDQRFEQAG